MNALPATEALRTIEQCGMSRQCLRRQVSLSPPNSAETNVTSVTEHSENINTFPKLEWSVNDHKNHDQDVPRRAILPPPNNDEHFPLSHHSESSTILGKRIQKDPQSRLVRSKSIKSSLCHLADRSISFRRRLGTSNEGCSGCFVGDSDAEQETLCKGINHRSGRLHQRDLLLSPLVAFGKTKHDGMEVETPSSALSCV